MLVGLSVGFNNLLSARCELNESRFSYKILANALTLKFELHKSSIGYPESITLSCWPPIWALMTISVYSCTLRLRECLCWSRCESFLAQVQCKNISHAIVLFSSRQYENHNFIKMSSWFLSVNQGRGDYSRVPVELGSNRPHCMNDWYFNV